MTAPAPAAPPRLPLHIARSRHRLKSGEEVVYAYLRYSVWDEAKQRHAPKQLASLGRTDRLDEERVETLEGFLKDWLRKDSSLPVEALAERFKAAAPAFKILCSRDFGLRWLIEQAWEELGYRDAIADLAAQTGHEFRVDVAIFAMVLVQLVAPRSKRAVARWQGANVFFPEGEALDVRQLYAAMDVLAEGYDEVEEAFSGRLRDLGCTVTRLLHDTTSLPFAVRYDDVERAEIEADRQASGAAQRAATVNDPPKRMRGHSKNKRRDLPQVVLEVVATDDALVVHHSTHAGNTADSALMPTTAARLSALGYREITWTGDSGMNSVHNRRALRAADFDLVLGEGVARTKVVRDVLHRSGRFRQHPDKPELSYKCVIAEATDEGPKGSNTGPCRLYVVRRHKGEEQHALRRIAKHVAKIEKTLAEGSAREREALLHHVAYKRYVRVDGRYKKGKRPAGKVILDRQKLQRLRTEAGKSVIACDDTTADPVAQDAIYRSLLDVERIFRRLKSTLRIGPIRHRRADRIDAHVAIGILAHNVGRWLELKSGETLERLQELFANARVQQVEVGAHTYWQCVVLEAEQERVIKQLGFAPPPERFTATLEPLHRTAGA